jgi:uncharacterized protein YdhG (YjbR/CyaY superfamily)
MPYRQGIALTHILKVRTAGAVYPPRGVASISTAPHILKFEYRTQKIKLQMDAVLDRREMPKTRKGLVANRDGVIPEKSGTKAVHNVEHQPKVRRNN